MFYNYANSIYEALKEIKKELGRLDLTEFQDDDPLKRTFCVIHGSSKDLAQDLEDMISSMYDDYYKRSSETKCKYRNSKSRKRTRIDNEDVSGKKYGYANSFGRYKFSVVVEKDKY